MHRLAEHPGSAMLNPFASRYTRVTDAKPAIDATYCRTASTPARCAGNLAASQNTVRWVAAASGLRNSDSTVRARWSGRVKQNMTTGASDTGEFMQPPVQRPCFGQQPPTPQPAL